MKLEELMRKIYLVCTNDYPGGENFSIHSAWSTAGGADICCAKLEKGRQYTEVLELDIDMVEATPESPAANLCASSAKRIQKQLDTR